MSPSRQHSLTECVELSGTSVVPPHMPGSCTPLPCPIACPHSYPAATNTFVATYVLAFISAVFNLVLAVTMVANRKSFGGAQSEQWGAGGLRSGGGGSSGNRGIRMVLFFMRGIPLPLQLLYHAAILLV